MNFTVGCNWDYKLIEVAKKYNVKELFGKLASDPVGGGRAAFMTPHIDKDYIKNYVEKLHEEGIEFNYLLNGVCFDNIEFTSKGQRKFRKFFDWLAEIKVDYVTLSNPFLAQIFKLNYPDIKVCVSSMTRVNSVIEAEYWKNLGADVLIIIAGRNFKLLKAIKKNVNIEVEVIANLICLHECPISYYHGTLATHASQNWHKSKGFTIPYCEIMCTYRKFVHPYELIASPWIRPEDLHYYEEIGMDRLKIVDRCSPTEYIEEFIKAYSEKKYNGNFADLLPGLKQSKPSQIPFLQKLKYLFKPFKYNMLKALKLRQAPLRPEVFIDNSKLDGFLEFIINQDCSMIPCEECGYCEKIAEKVLKIDEEERNALIKKYKSIIKDLDDGSFFSYFGPIKSKKKGNK